MFHHDIAEVLKTACWQGRGDYGRAGGGDWVFTLDSDQHRSTNESKKRKFCHNCQRDLPVLEHLAGDWKMEY